MTYESRETQFLEATATEFGWAQKRRFVFIERFKEANADLNDTDLADVLNLTPNQVRDHLKVICDTLAAAGCNCGTTGKGRWKLAKAWLRGERYPQWQERHHPQPNLPLHPEDIWHRLRERAQPQTQWIDCIEPKRCGSQKGLKVPPSQNLTPSTLTANTPYFVYLDLRISGGYLLLLNQGLNTRYLLAPSAGFVPNPRLSGNLLWIPQSGATQAELEFDAGGKEEFLAVVLPQPLDLPWLQPNDTEPAPECHPQRLHELWERIQQQPDCRVFHREFWVENN